ncbi:hypothetical protein [Salinispora vitiensis]|uniref:hypothetical protein n=1 Tax=Salinispora vitiensis TaxID=999544 RepID=UPI000371A0F0|nr:hypothetical protein [Salinispora vitiensis]
MSYYANLAFQLRLRRLPEPQIAEILREVRRRSDDSGQEPAHQFGSPGAYAAQFPKGKIRSLPTRTAIATIGLAAAVTAVDMGMNLFANSRLQLGGVRVIFVLLAVEAMVVIAAIAADHRLPRSFRDA